MSGSTKQPSERFTHVLWKGVWLKTYTVYFWSCLLNIFGPRLVLGRSEEEKQGKGVRATVEFQGRAGREVL